MIFKAEVENPGEISLGIAEQLFWNKLFGCQSVLDFVSVICNWNFLHIPVIESK